MLYVNFVKYLYVDVKMCGRVQPQMVTLHSAVLIIVDNAIM